MEGGRTFQKGKNECRERRNELGTGFTSISICRRLVCLFLPLGFRLKVRPYLKKDNQSCHHVLLILLCKPCSFNPHKRVGVTYHVCTPVPSVNA